MANGKEQLCEACGEAVVVENGAYRCLACGYCGYSEELQIAMGALKREIEKMALIAKYLYKGGRFEEAAVYFQVIAEEEHLDAQFRLGECYEKGLGVERNLEKAVSWYRRAARRRYPEAQNALGDCYFKGIGVGQNYRIALKLYLGAALAGYALSQFNLGFCYEHGYGVEPNADKAIHWYKLAADQGHKGAVFCLKELDVTAEYYRAAAMAGNAEAQYYLGTYYEKGDGVPRDIQTAIEWYKKSAKQGYSAAKKRLIKLRVES